MTAAEDTAEAPQAAPPTDPPTAPPSGSGVPRTPQPGAEADARVHFVGAGPGDRSLLTLRAHELLAAADVVVHDRDVTADVLGAVAAGARLLLPAGSAVAVAEVLAAEAAAGHRVVRLVGGDPWGREEVVREALLVAAEGVRFDVVPGVPYGTGSAAATGAPGGRAQVLVDVRRDGDLRASGPDEQVGVDWAWLAGVPVGVSVVTTAGDLGKVAAALVEHGRDGLGPVLVTERPTGARQRSVITTFDRVEADTAGFAGTVVLATGPTLGDREALAWHESRALYGWTVLVPRTKEQAGTMSALLRRHGALALEVPTISVEKPRLPTHMERAVKGLADGQYEWIVFTSANAVRAVREKFEEFGVDARQLSGIKVAAVGEATAQAVRAYGVEPDLVPAGEQSSAGLVAEFPPYEEGLDPVNGVLLPRADIATETLVTGLTEIGWQVDDVTAYRTVRSAPPPADIREAIKGGGFDAVLFTSSSTARNLVGIAGKPHHRTVVACIGPRTAETAQELGLTVDVIPTVANVPALVAATAAYAERIARTGERPAAGPAGRPAAKEPPLP